MGLTHENSGPRPPRLVVAFQIPEQPLPLVQGFSLDPHLSFCSSAIEA